MTVLHFSTFHEALTVLYSENHKYSHKDFKVYSLKSEEGLLFSPYRIFVWHDSKRDQWNSGYLLPYHIHRFPEFQNLLKGMNYSRGSRFFPIETLHGNSPEESLTLMILRAANPEDMHIVFNLAFPKMNTVYKSWEAKTEEIRNILARTPMAPYLPLAEIIFSTVEIPHYARYYKISSINYTEENKETIVGLKISLNPKGSAVMPWHSQFEETLKGTSCRLHSAGPGKAIISHIPAVLVEYNSDSWCEETMKEKVLYQKNRRLHETFLNMFRK